MRVALFVALGMLAGCVSGTEIVTGKQRSPIAPEMVRFYADPPSAFDTIVTWNKLTKTA